MNRKWQQIGMVNKVATRNENIDSIGIIEDIASHLVEVDLQDNLLYSWTEVLFIYFFVFLFSSIFSEIILYM